MTVSALFHIVVLPATILFSGGESTGGVVLVRQPSRAELDAIERAAAADDVDLVHDLAYRLTGLDLRQVALLGPQARAVLDDAVTARIAEAHVAIID